MFHLKHSYKNSFTVQFTQQNTAHISFGSHSISLPLSNQWGLSQKKSYFEKNFGAYTELSLFK